MSVVDKIQHYQRSIEKCSDNEERMMHCISKLYRLPVTVQHLQETGVGRTVYALRKYDGDVGEAAKALVAKWKNLVADEASSDGEDEDEAGAPDPPEDYGYSSDSQKPEKNVDNDRRESRNHNTEESGRDNLNKSESSKHSSKGMSRESSKTKDNHDKSHSSNERDKHKYSKNELEKRESKSDSKHDRDKHDTKHDSKSERKSKGDGDPKNNRHNARKEDRHKLKDKDKGKSETSQKDIGKVSSSSSSGSSKNNANSEESHRKRKLDSSAEIEKRRKNSESENGEDNNQPLSDSEEGGGKVLSNTLGASECEEEKVPKIEIKQEPLSPPSKNKRNDSQRNDSRSERKSSKEKSRDSCNKSKSSSIDNKSRRDEEKDKKKEDKSKDHRKSEKRKSEGHHSGGESSKSKSYPSSSSSKNKSINEDKEKDKHGSKKERSSTELKTAKTTFKEPKEKKKIKQEINGDEGIDCNSGASFAEALGMCTKPLSSRKRNNSSPSSLPVKIIKTEPGISSSTPNNKPPTKLKTEAPSNDDPHPLSLLAANVKLEPLSVDLASTLPEISPNYKPLPYISPVYRKHEEDKALSQVMYAKNQRTKVYSGNKCGYTNVPSLYEMCIRVLIENIEALEFTGGVPYYILKPVLERATADQLFMLEHHNPYLIDDTDVLWQFHCNREFRNKQREEMETWREMYMRCLDEREAKLKALTANIKQSIDKSVPVRLTKLAYVNNVVKPPRNILRKQAKYGTASATPNSTSDLKKKLISGDGSATATNISVPPPPMSRMKTSPSGVVKKTKAPLMAKALQLIKGRYKR